MSNDFPPLTLEVDYCRQRQIRLAHILQRRELECALLVRPEHVQYFTGFRPGQYQQAVVAVCADGDTILSAPNEVPLSCAAADVVTFAADWACTLRQDQLSSALAALPSRWSIRATSQRFGVEASVNAAAMFPWISDTGKQTIDIEPDLWMLRRCKDPDELLLIQRAIDCTEAMYHRARRVIAPGITELEVYNELHAAAVQVAGEPLLAVGNDFQCNSAGGPPRSRPAEAGELFILDLGVSYRGYYSDNCRTFCVGGPPNERQRQAWSAIASVLQFVEQTVRPGVSARELYQQAKRMLDQVMPGAFFHHLGHGIGLFPHEAPHLNDHWDDQFQPGDVFTAEPGLYAPELRAGIRLEQDYVVTADGVKRLTSFPLEL